MLSQRSLLHQSNAAVYPSCGELWFQASFLACDDLMLFICTASQDCRGSGANHLFVFGVVYVVGNRVCSAAISRATRVDGRLSNI